MQNKDNNTTEKKSSGGGSMHSVVMLSPGQLDTLRHMLGINTPWDQIPRPYRNYAAVNPGDPKFIELEGLGMVEKYLTAGDIHNQYEYYRCTEAGKLEAMRSHKDIRYSKKKRIYLRFLSAQDAYSDLTFKQFLTDPYFKQARQEA